MYKMKDVCQQTNLKYETLKFYCNEGLIPNIKRDTNNHRVFDEQDIAWIQSLQCLKKCNMSIKEMKYYLKLCLEGERTIKERKEFLQNKYKELLKKEEEIQKSLDYINNKQQFYDDILDNKIPYTSNLIKK